MGHASQLYISNLVKKLRGNRRFWGLDKKKRYGLRAAGHWLWRGCDFLHRNASKV
jgi:hypothetical protein